MISNSEANNLLSELTLKAALLDSGFGEFHKIVNTAQGSIWRVVHKLSNQNMIVKVANRYLCSQSIAIINGKPQYIKENICSEATILQHLTNSSKTKTNKSDYITKYYGFFSTAFDYILLMEDGGDCLFDFCVKAHELIAAGTLTICEWFKMVRFIFKKMVESLQHIHSHNVSHNDISLENFLISAVDFRINNDNKIEFITDNVKVVLCDFGIATQFDSDDFTSTKYCGKNNYKSNEVMEEKKPFDAASNDIFCVGVCLFMLAIGVGPFVCACKSDKRFVRVMNGDFVDILTEWNKIEYINNDLIELFGIIFTEENKRCKLSDMLNSKWMKH